MNPLNQEIREFGRDSDRLRAFSPDVNMKRKTTLMGRDS